MWIAQWSEDSMERGDSVEQLDELLNRLNEVHRNTLPILVTVERATNGDSLAIGLGRTETVLNYVPGSADPPYLSSLGRADAAGVVEFTYMGEVSEIPTRNLIPMTIARSALRQFIERGDLSTEVEWEVD